MQIGIIYCSHSHVSGLYYGYHYTPLHDMISKYLKHNHDLQRHLPGHIRIDALHLWQDQELNWMTEGRPLSRVFGTKECGKPMALPPIAPFFSGKWPSFEARKTWPLGTSHGSHGNKEKKHALSASTAIWQKTEISLNIAMDNNSHLSC